MPSHRSAFASDPVLEAHGLGKRYGSTWALQGLNLAVPRGTITALVGPNGAGKSTLMKLWMAFERPTTGTVAVDGVDPRGNRRRALGSIGYVPQAPALYRDLSVADHLSMARSLRPTFDAGHAADRLRQLGIPLGSRPGQLSGGEQAQVGLAIALGTRAPILLLDEPLASLDPLARRDFVRVLLDATRAEGLTVVLSSHIVSDIESACDRLVVLGRGEVRLDARIDDLRTEHAVVVGADGLSGPGFVAWLDGTDPVGWYLVRRGNGAPEPSGLPATLEDIVIGYLASGRRIEP